MKRVSFEVAKTLKKAGYPQAETEEVYTTDGNLDCYSCGGVAGIVCCDAPTVIDVWLWLWREKKIYLNTNTSRKDIVCIYFGSTIIHEIKDMELNDPEDAINAAIWYLVKNNLIK